MPQPHLTDQINLMATHGQIVTQLVALGVLLRGQGVSNAQLIHQHSQQLGIQSASDLFSSMVRVKVCSRRSGKKRSMN